MVGSAVDDWSLGEVVWIFTNDNETVFLVSGTSKGLSPGRLFDKDTMDVCYVESGAEATVG